jgi:hypothetical protein
MLANGVNIAVFLKQGSGLGHPWSSASGPKKRIGIAWIFASLLDRGKQFTANDIETGLRQVVKSQVLEDPVCSPDHIRVAMVENGFLNRDEQGRSYRVAENFIDYFGDFSRLLSQSVGLSNEMIVCAICTRPVEGRGMQEHILKLHINLPEVNEIIAKYFT